MRGLEGFTGKKCKNKHCSPMSNSAWCDINGKNDIFKLHDLCHNPKFKSQKQTTFPPSQFQLEGSGFKNTMRKIFKGTEQNGNNFNN